MATAVVNVVQSKLKTDLRKGTCALERHSSTSNAFIESVMGCCLRELDKWCFKFIVYDTSVSTEFQKPRPPLFTTRLLSYSF